MIPGILQGHHRNFFQFLTSWASNVHFFPVVTAMELWLRNKARVPIKWISLDSENQGAAKIRDVPAGKGGMCWHHNDFRPLSNDISECTHTWHRLVNKTKFSISTILCHHLPFQYRNTFHWFASNLPTPFLLEWTDSAVFKFIKRLFSFKHLVKLNSYKHSTKRESDWKQHLSSGSNTYWKSDLSRMVGLHGNFEMMIIPNL